MENALSTADSKNDSDLQRSLVALFRKLLQSDRIDEDASFYQHGGTSLSATLLLAEIVSQHGVTISFEEFEKSNTPLTLARRIASRKGDGRLPAFERRASHEESEFALAAPQRSRSWYLGAFQTERAADGGDYNSGYAAWLEGRIDLASLERAFNLAVQRHDSLGTSFVEREGRVVQHFRPHLPVEFRVEPAPEVIRAAYQARSTGPQELALSELEPVSAFVHEPFDWSKGHIVRCRVFVLGESAHLLLLAGNHVAFDLMSRGVLLRDVHTIYERLIDGGSHTQKRPAQYRDYLDWERRYLESGAYADNLGYWIKYLSGSEPELHLPVALPRAQARKVNGAYRQDKLLFTLEGEIMQRLRLAAKDYGVTPYVLMFTAFAAALAKLSRQERFTIGTQVANRRHQEVLETCGCFAQPVALLCHLSPTLNLREALRIVHRDLNAAIEHQPVALPAVAEAMQREGGPRRHPLYQCSFEYFDAREQSFAPAGVTCHEVLIPYHFRRTSNEIMALLWERSWGVAGVFLYANELYTPAQIAALSGTYRAMLGRLAGSAPETLGELLAEAPEEVES